MSLVDTSFDFFPLSDDFCVALAATKPHFFGSNFCGFGQRNLCPPFS